jgi:hypothetical protein
MTTTTLTRPNGKPYRARKPGLFVQPWEDEDAGYPTAGVIVFGTLDVAEAHEAAMAAAMRYFDCNAVVDAYASWFRNSYKGGQRVWVADAGEGAARRLLYGGAGVIHSRNDAFQSPYVLWIDYSLEGWAPYGCASLQECYERVADYSAMEFVITKQPITVTFTEVQHV